MSIIICVCVIFCIYLFLAWRRGKVSKSETLYEPPIFPGALPIIGHAHLLYGDTTHILNFIKRVTVESVNIGGVVKVFTGHLTYYVLTDPDDFLTAVNACSEKSEIYHFAKRFLGDGLLISNDQTWKKHRKLLNPMFTQLTLNSFIGVFNEQGRRLVNNFEDKLGNGPFEYEQYLLVWTLESNCKTVMGVDTGDEKKENNDYINALDSLLKLYTERVLKLWLHNEYAYSWSSVRKAEENFIRILKTRVGQVLLKRKQIINESVKHGVDNMADHFRPFVDHILMLSTEKEVLTDKEVLDEVNTLVAAGYESSAHTLSYIFMVLGAHKEVQHRLYKELETLFENTDRDVDKYDLPKMVYTEAVIKETLRLYPTVPIFARRSTTDINLKNYTLRAGCQVVISALGVGRHPMWGADADQFKPERWLDPASLPQNHNAYVAFGIGKRACIGKTYAMMFMKVTIAHILRRCKLTSYNDNPTLKLELVLKAATPPVISLESRK